MTDREVQRLFVEHPFSEAKKMLVEEIERSGYELTGNENVFELKAIATKCSRETVNVSSHAEYVATGEANQSECGSNAGSGSASGEMQESETEPTNVKLEKIGNPGNSEGTESSEDTSVNQEPSGGNLETSETQSEGGGEQGNQETESGNEQEPASGESEPNQNESSCKEKKPQRRKRRTQTQEQQMELPSQQEQAKEKTEQELEQKLDNEARQKMEDARKLMEQAEKIREERRRKEEEERKKREERERRNNRHQSMDEVIKRLKTLGKAFLVGPAGTGKSTLAMEACRELFSIEGDLNAVVKSGKFAQISFSPDTVSADMLGFTDVNGIFHETDIIRVFRDGGLILFDEMDDADASLLVKLNTMLANRVIPIPGGVVTQSKDCYIVGTANTYGKGGNSMYVGRSRLDGATLDRWKMATINIEYDVNLEDGIIDSVVKDERYRKSFKVIRNTIRELIADNRWKQICSTRFVIDGAKMLANGYTDISVVNTFLLDWSEAERKIVAKAVAGRMRK